MLVKKNRQKKTMFRIHIWTSPLKPNIKMDIKYMYYTPKSNSALMESRQLYKHTELLTSEYKQTSSKHTIQQTWTIHKKHPLQAIIPSVVLTLIYLFVVCWRRPNVTPHRSNGNMSFMRHILIVWSKHIWPKQTDQWIIFQPTNILNLCWEQGETIRQTRFYLNFCDSTKTERTIEHQVPSYPHILCLKI